MKTSRFPLLFASLLLALTGVMILATFLLPSPVANALSSHAPNAEITPPPLDAEIYVVRAYYDDYQMVRDLSTWTEPWEVRADLGFVVLGVNRAEWDLLQTLGFRVELDEEATHTLNTPRTTEPTISEGGYPAISGFACYRTVEGTFMTAEDLVTAHPTLASWVDVGDSWEKTAPGGATGYDMNVLILTNQAIPGPKPKLFLTSSIHAREYTPAELSTRFAEYLLSQYGNAPDVTWILDYHEIHLMLHANPDGRKWAEAGQSWRKNTDNNFCTDSTYRGVDLNRNFDFQWGCCGGSSPNACSYTYRGPSPASEPETQAIQNYMRAIFPDQRGDALTDPAPTDAAGLYIDLHSYSKLVLWPWGFTFDSAPNGTAFQTLGRKFAYFNNYTPQQSIALYPTDGTTDDFAYGDLGVAAYTFELGNEFFEDCAYFENTILPQNLSALVYAAKTARTPYLTPAGPDTLAPALSVDSIIAGLPTVLTVTLNDTRFNNSFGTEPTQNIAAAEYYLDTPPWITTTLPVAFPMTPADGSFDASIETATAALDTTGLSAGQYLVYIRGQDVDGNWGPFSAVFLWVETAAQDLTKTATVTTTLPGEVFTYTLTYHAELTGTHTFSLTLRDALPEEVTVLTDSIRLDGALSPGLYNPAGHAIELTQAGAFTGSQTLIVTLQVSADPAPPGIIISNAFTTTARIDGNLAPPQTSHPVTVEVGDTGAPWLVLEKTTSNATPEPGQTFTYTLQADLIHTGEHTYTLSLLDALPAEITFAGNLLLNGLPAPGLYDTVSHTISGTFTGTLTDTATLLLTFQAMITETVTATLPITNTLSGNMTSDGLPALYYGDAVIIIYPLFTHEIYFPFISRE